MLLSINQSNDNNLLLDINGLKYINVAGVIGGVLWTHGSSKEIDGEFQSHTWEEKLVTSKGTVTIGFVESGQAAQPINTKTQNIEDLKKEIEKLSKESNEFASKAESLQQEQPSQERTIYEAAVILDDKTVFQFTGEHIQFDVNWNSEKGCKLQMLGMKNYETEEEITFTGDLINNEYIIHIKS